MTLMKDFPPHRSKAKDKLDGRWRLSNAPRNGNILLNQIARQEGINNSCVNSSSLFIHYLATSFISVIGHE